MRDVINMNDIIVVMESITETHRLSRKMLISFIRGNIDVLIGPDFVEIRQLISDGKVSQFNDKKLIEVSKLLVVRGCYYLDFL